MGTLNVLTNQWLLDASITSSNEESDAPASRLLDPLPSFKYRSQDTVGIEFTMNAGSSLPFDTLWVGYTNVTDTATIQVKADNVLANLDGTPALDFNPISARLPGDLSSWTFWHILINFGVIHTYQYVRVIINDSSNTHFEAGVVLLDQHFQPSLDPVRGSSVTWDDPSERVEMDSGEPRYQRKRRHAHGRWTLEHQSESDTHNWNYLDRIYGVSTPYLVWEVPDDTDYQQSYMVYGEVNLSPRRKSSIYGWRHTLVVDAREL